MYLDKFALLCLFSINPAGTFVSIGAGSDIPNVFCGVANPSISFISLFVYDSGSSEGSSDFDDSAGSSVSSDDSGCSG